MMFKIGNIVVKNPVVLAPMAGISNPTYIKICESMDLGYAITELISAEAVVRENKKTLDMLKGIEKIKVPVAVQLFGSNASVLASAAKIITDIYKNVFIDINMGCPVPKVAVRSESGSALLKNPELIREIVTKVVSSVDVPVTVKIRSGWDEKSINASEVAKICESAGASAIAIHARTRSQGYSGKANWNIIKEVVESVTIPVIGNGDILTPEDAKKMMDETGCIGVMIGRGALGNPWLIKDTVNYLKCGIKNKEVNNKEKIAMMKYHLQELCKDKNEKVAVLEMRTVLMYYLKGMPDTKELKLKIVNCKTKDELLSVLNDYENKVSTV